MLARVKRIISHAEREAKTLSSGSLRGAGVGVGQGGVGWWGGMLLGMVAMLCWGAHLRSALLSAPQFLL